MTDEFNAKEEVAKLQTETKTIRHRAKKSKLVKYQSQLMMMRKEGALKSTRTGDNYKNRLLQVAKSDYLKEQNIRLYDLSPAQAIEYLEIRGQEVGQKTLDMERQAIQSMLRHVTQKLGAKETLKVIKSEKEQVLTSRAYAPNKSNSYNKHKPKETHSQQKLPMPQDYAHMNYSP
jgi:hypothetical protein